MGLLGSRSLNTGQIISNWKQLLVLMPCDLNASCQKRLHSRSDYHAVKNDAAWFVFIRLQWLCLSVRDFLATYSFWNVHKIFGQRKEHHVQWLLTCLKIAPSLSFSLFISSHLSLSLSLCLCLFHLSSRSHTALHKHTHSQNLAFSCQATQTSKDSRLKTGSAVSSFYKEQKQCRGRERDRKKKSISDLLHNPL